MSEIWRAFGPKPWGQDELKISPGPQLVEKIRDTVGLYMDPPVNAALFAVDDKPRRESPTTMRRLWMRQRTSRARSPTPDSAAEVRALAPSIATNCPQRHRSTATRTT